MGRPTGSLMVALAALAPAGIPGQTFVGPEYILDQKPEQSLPMWLHPDQQSNVATCVIDVGIATIFLGKASTAVNAAVTSCDRQKKDKAFCSASISGVISGFGYAAGFLARAAADCAKSFQVVNTGVVTKADCAADLSTLLASLALLAKAGSSMNAVCDKNVVRAPHNGMNINRRLKDLEGALHHLDKLGSDGQSGPAVANLRNLTEIFKRRPFMRVPGQPSEKQLALREHEISECVFDVGQATFFLMRAGLMVNAGVGDCTPFEIRTGGPDAQAKCAVDFSSMLSAFAFTASGIAYATFHCPWWKNLHSACAGAIANLIAALAQIAASGASFQQSCGHHGERRMLSLPDEPRSMLV